MGIKLAECCANCENHITGSVCSVQEIVTSENQVCESYEFRVALHRESDCLKCSKFQTSNCAHPKKASEGMLCTVWQPNAMA